MNVLCIVTMCVLAAVPRCFGQLSDTPSSHDQAHPEDLRVYASILQSKRTARDSSASKVLWIVNEDTFAYADVIEKTFKHLKLPKNEPYRSHWADNFRKLRSVPRTVRADYRRRNWHVVAVPGSLTGQGWLVLDRKSAAVGWAKLKEKYSDMDGMIAFSLPGYDKTKTTAIVLVREMVEEHCGYVSLLRLKKLRNQWSMVWEVDLIAY